MAPHTLAALLLSSAFVLSSCQRDEDEPTAPTAPPTPLSIASFSKLAVGNYWIYKQTEVDSLEVDLGMTFPEDSIFISGDSVIDGVTWFVQRKATGGVVASWVTFLRDSANCLVQRGRGIQFSASDFDEVLQLDSNNALVQAVIRWSVSSTQYPVSVGAGDYQTYRMIGDVTMYGLPTAPGWKFPRSYWAEGVGKVRYLNYYSASTTGRCFELLRYHVQ